MRTLHMGARAFIPVALAGAILFSLAPSAPAAAATTTTSEAQQIVRIAEAQVGDPWHYGSTGPRSFDCSGLVRYAFAKAGMGGRVHGRSARTIYRWFKARGLASRHNPKVGDLVIWGRGTHVGIYIGHGRAISTLRGGVRVHRINVLTARFTAYLHTGMSARAAT